MNRARTSFACALALASALASRPATAQFTYDAPGDLEGSESGRADSRVYVPGMRFPMEAGPAYANSQIYGRGGYMGPGGGECDAANFRYPWHDNYCETRSWDMPLCPTGMGHQGQDIRTSDCRAGVHPAVAVADGTITNVGSYSVYLTASDGTRFDYLHMSGVRVRVGDTVTRGQVIGMVANNFGGEATTVHLHFNIRQSVSGVGSVYVPPYMSLIRAYEALIGETPPPPPPPTGPQLMAEYVHQSFPLSSEPFPLRPGATFTGYLELRNRGSVTWRPGVTFLRTTEPRDGVSPLAGADWITPSEPATVDRVVAPGATGRFGFTVRAPATPGEYDQFLGAYHDGIGWFGDDGGPIDRWFEIRVTVEAVTPTDPDDDGDGAPQSRDCDDARADVFPGAPEVCGDGVDQSCDGVDPPCVEPGEDAGSAADAGSGDDAGSASGEDAGDEEVDAASGTPPRRSAVSGGCACTVASRRSAHGAPWLLLAIGMVVVLRRRSR